MKPRELIQMLGAFLAGAGLVFAVGRWVGDLEFRLKAQEAINDYYHGLSHRIP